MDETKREIYNRFGSSALDFDPRSDELKLLVGLGIVYLFWGVVVYVATFPKGARACRTWVTIVLIAMAIGEVFLCLTETTLPTWMPGTTTEHEFVKIMHSVFPAVLVWLRCISEYVYVDVEECTRIVLSEVNKHQKVGFAY